MLPAKNLSDFTLAGSLGRPVDINALCSPEEATTAKSWCDRRIARIFAKSKHVPLVIKRERCRIFSTRFNQLSASGVPAADTPRRRWLLCGRILATRLPSVNFSLVVTGAVAWWLLRTHYWDCYSLNIYSVLFYAPLHAIGQLIRSLWVVTRRQSLSDHAISPGR